MIISCNCLGSPKRRGWAGLCKVFETNPKGVLVSLLWNEQGAWGVSMEALQPERGDYPRPCMCEKMGDGEIDQHFERLAKGHQRSSISNAFLANIYTKGFKYVARAKDSTKTDSEQKSAVDKAAAKPRRTQRKSVSKSLASEDSGTATVGDASAMVSLEAKKSGVGAKSNKKKSAAPEEGAQVVAQGDELADDESNSFESDPTEADSEDIELASEMDGADAGEPADEADAGDDAANADDGIDDDGEEIEPRRNTSLSPDDASALKSEAFGYAKDAEDEESTSRVEDADRLSLGNGEDVSSDDDDDDEDEDDSDAPAATSETSTVKTEKATGVSQSFLAMYFKDMAELDVLRPEQEFDTAREIEKMELCLWALLLTGYLPAAEFIADTVEAAMEKPFEHFENYRDLTRKLNGRRPSGLARRRLDAAVGEMSIALREADIDRLFVDAAVSAVRRLGRSASQGMPADPKIKFDPTSKEYRNFVSAVTVEAHTLKAAKNEFVKANLRLVVSIARRFNHGRLPLADLIQEGNIGLMKAVERYDYRRGFRFSTYASWWIRHAISRALADKGRAVRLPVHMIDAYHKVAKSERELQSKLERPATPEEISAATGIEPEKLEKMKTFLSETPVSLDRPISDDDGRKLIDVLVDPNQGPTAPEQLVQQEIQGEMVKLLEWPQAH